MELQKLYEKNWDKIRFALKIDGLKDELSEKLISIDDQALMVSNAKICNNILLKTSNTLIRYKSNNGIGISTT